MVGKSLDKVYPTTAALPRESTFTAQRPSLADPPEITLADEYDRRNGLGAFWDPDKPGHYNVCGCCSSKTKFGAKDALRLFMSVSLERR